MSSRHLFWVAALALVGACGDDDGSSPGEDAGSSVEDAGSTEDAGRADAGPVETFELAFRFVDLDGEPLEGVWAVGRSDAGRVVGQSDAGGEVTLSVPYEVAVFDALVALEGYRMLANLGFAPEGFDAERGEDGVVELTLAPISSEPGETFTLRVQATGVPEGGRWCAGLSSWLTVCNPVGEVFETTQPVDGIGATFHDGLTGYTLDAAGELVDFVEADYTIGDGSRTATLAFDETLPSEPTITRSITLTLPDDAESPFRTETLDDEWHGWISVVDAERQLARGVLSGVEVLDDRVSFQLDVFEPAVGLSWAIAAYADFRDPVRTFRWFSEAPSEDTLAFMDVPRVTEGEAWDGAFAWTAPADDVDRYQALFRNNAGRVVVQALARAPSLSLPALPEGYDREVSFPFPDAPGTLQIVAVRGDTPVADEEGVVDYEVDGESATGPRHAIRW